MDKYIKNTNPDMYAQLLAYRQVHMGADLEIKKREFLPVFLF